MRESEAVATSPPKAAGDAPMAKLNAVEVRARESKREREKEREK